MQDIRKPYNRSRSNQEASKRSISSKVEEFETRAYSNDEEPVRIPISRSARVRRNLDQMEMYPRKTRDEMRSREDVEEKRYEEATYRDPRTHYKRKSSSFGTLAFIGTITVLVIGVGLLTYVFNSATVTIVPKHSDVEDFNKPLSFSQDGADANSIPFIVATSSITKTKTLSLSETKKIEAKALGKIIIYNNFDTNTQKLIKGTRFASSDGKIYRIDQSVTIPGKTSSKPGSVSVNVYADSYGSDYNSDPTDFTIPGFKGTARYSGFFAHSDGPITGGSSGNVSIASLSDLNAAKDELALELSQDVKAELKKVQKEGYISMYSAEEITYEDNQQDILQGVTSTYKVTATGYLMLADGSKFASTVAHDVRDYANEPVRLGYVDTLNYTRKDTDHITKPTTLNILVEGKPRIIWVSDVDSIKKMVSGKSRNDFKPIMKSINSIESAEISFSPLWLSSFPNDVNKVSIVESLPKR